MTVNELKKVHESIIHDVRDRLAEFDAIWRDGTDEVLFRELVFCLLTPQSKARSCWNALLDIESLGLLEQCTEEELHEPLRRVRFRFTKAKRVVTARELFTEDGVLAVRKHIDGPPAAAREWLVDNVNGLGYKEASHFLRNVGRGQRLAILDRHILGNLVELGVLDEVPSSTTPKRYIEIEQAMAGFSDGIGIPMDELDLVLWYLEAGEVFK